MTKLASETVAAVNQLTINYDARTYTSAKSDNDEVLHTTSHTISHLADSGCISVVGKSYWNAELIREHLSQRHYAVATPLKVGSELNSTIIIVAVRSTDTHSLNLIDTTNLVDDNLQSLNRSVYIRLRVVAITLCLDRCSGLDVATAINDAKY